MADRLRRCQQARSGCSPRRRIEIQRSEIGCRAWLAISGGIDIASMLGSRSTDLRATSAGCMAVLCVMRRVAAGQMSAVIPASRDYRQNFVLDCPTRLGEPCQTQSDGAVHSRRGLDRFNASTLQRFTLKYSLFRRFRSYGVRFDGPS